MTQREENDIIEICKKIFLRENYYETGPLWDQLRPWLATKGYDLYDYDGRNWYPRHYEIIEPDYYSANMGGDPDMKSINGHPLQTEFYGRVGFAQDSTCRHFALKLVETGSEEYKILTFLRKNQEEAFSNCVLPALDFFEIGMYSLAVMPRWGGDPHLPWFSTVEQAGIFIRDILKAFVFLHRNHIVYQDIKLGNILLDHFAAVDLNCLPFNEMRIHLMNTNRIRYALCDFDSSFLLSPPTSGQPIRLPSELSFDIYQSKPHDTCQGEPDYDPFVFDIGLLGIFLWSLFSSNIQNFPLIVPLVDRMITGKLKDRFSAVEALKFVEDYILGGSADLLDQPLESLDNRKGISWDYDYRDKWANLPADFVAKWGAYKAPKSSFRDRVLRTICMRIYKGYKVIKFFRSL